MLPSRPIAPARPSAHDTQAVVRRTEGDDLERFG